MVRPAPLLIALAAGSLGSLGCIDVNYSSREVERRILTTRHTLSPVDLRATMHQTGTVVDGEAARICDVHEMTEIKQTMRLEPKNKVLGLDLFLLGLGLGFAGLGAGITADARHVYDSKENGRLYNPFGKDTATGAGVALVVLGGLILITPVIDLMRHATAPNKEEVNVLKEKGARIGGQVPCVENARAANERVVARVGSATLDLGATDTEGRFSVDLANKVPRDWLHGLGDPSRVQIWVGSKRVGEVDVTPASAAADSAPKAQLAISAEDVARAKDAAKSAHEACQRACAAACASKAACADLCVGEACK